MILFVSSVLLSTSESTSSSSSNKTDLSTGGSVSLDSGRFTNMLLVTSSEGMVNRVHTNTLDSGPAMSLSLVFVILVTSLQDRLVTSSSSSDNAEHSSGRAGDGLLGSGRELEFSLVVLVGVGDDDGVGAGGSGEGSSVTHVLFDIADD